MVFSIFLEDIIVESPDHLKYGQKHIISAAKLFSMDEDLPLLKQKKVELFHQLVPRLLFSSKRACLNIQVAVAFVCTIVKKSTEQD